MRGIEILDHWKFYLGQPEGPHLLETNDSEWRTVTLPHDWSVEFDFNQEEGEACTGYLLGGIGWYRRHFLTTEAMCNSKTVFNFDGIYNRATIYCNGEVIKFHPYGYSPALIDVSPYLNPVGEDNLIAVHVDHSRYADSRWYTGSGIYRKVSMFILPKVHVPIWGTKITTESVEDSRAMVKASITLNNTMKTVENRTVRLSIVDPLELCVFKTEVDVLIDGEVDETIEVHAPIDKPMLWDIYQGNRYKCLVELLKKGEVIQSQTEFFGIRTFRFDANKGFFLNGQSTLIKGVCLHHDAGLVGAAVPGDVWRRRLTILKEGGCNAIRTAHNPFSEDFLDICDEMGFLVQEEFFDDWDHPKDKRTNTHEKVIDYITRSYTEFFRDYGQSDLQDTIRRDINHPCIFQWSIGNEIEWTYPKYKEACGFFSEDALGYAFWRKPPYQREEIARRTALIPRDEYDIGSTAHKLARWTKEIDTTRPVIANCILPSLSYENGYIDALDMVGYSYRHVMYDYGHKHFPNMPITGTENKAQWHEWEAVLEHDYIPGVFLWMGIDHMGEAWVQKSWPRKASNLGLLDLACFERPAYHMFKTLWSNETHIKLFTQTENQSLFIAREDGRFEYKSKGGYKRRTWYWQDVNNYWKYKDGESTIVEVYASCDSVELFLNDESFGIKYLKDFEDRIYKWKVPYKVGTLSAVGRNGHETYTDSLTTTGPIAKVEVSLDKEVLSQSSDSAVHVTAQIKDENGYPIHNEEVEVTFICSEGAKILGVDNGHPDNVSKYQNNTIRTNEGKCLLILQSNDLKMKEITVSASVASLGIESDERGIQVMA